MIIEIALSVFIFLELSNVVALYFRPEMSQANAMGAFKQWEQSKSDPNLHKFVQYLAYWVAGSKLIFISLLMVIVLFGSDQVQLYSLAVLIISIATYYWKLKPLINELDTKGLIQPEGYSSKLTLMITSFILILSVAGIIDLIM